MSIESAIAEIELSQPGLSHEAMLIELRARTVTVYGMAAGAEISGVMLQFGLLSLIRDQANATGEHTALRNMSIALKDRFLPDGQINMGHPGNVAVLDAFLTDATVTAILGAQGVDPAIVRGAIMQLGANVEPEFSGLTAKQVVAVRDPVSVAIDPVESPESSVIECSRGAGILASVVVSGVVPASTALEVHIATSVDNVTWTPFRYAGAVGVSDAAAYTVNINPQLTQRYNRIKFVSKEFILVFSLGAIGAY